MPKDRTSNGFDGDQLSKYLIEIDKADEELDRLKSDHWPVNGLEGGCGTRWRARKKPD